ncbi:MAG: hypothetical protein LW808_002960 [Verrucomicrobiota bacterium]|nr:MAG: hypothetical protein LW808_002960 [Verrucomicrobiota bacterium]
MMQEVLSQGGVPMALGASVKSTPAVIEIYRNALDLFTFDPECAAVLGRLYERSKTGGNMQDVFASASEDDVRILSDYAEKQVVQEQLPQAVAMFQFLTLLSPGGAAVPYTYLRLAETLSALNIDAGLEIFDFIVNIFPDNPALLVSAAQHYLSDDRPKRALRLLKHAQEVCEHNIKVNPSLEELLDAIGPLKQEAENTIASRQTD